MVSEASSVSNATTPSTSPALEGLDEARDDLAFGSGVRERRAVAFRALAERGARATMFAGPDRERMAVFPTRAVALPDGRTAYSFTMFQGPDMPDALFEVQHASLRREFANIEAVFAR